MQSEANRLEVTAANTDEGYRILSVGCGKQESRPSVVRLDISADVDPDVVWDLGKFPYPFSNASFDVIECFDVIEHLHEIPPTMEEFHRILKPGGILKITTPHFSCANSYIDPTHRWHLSYFTFDYFCDGHELSYYSKARFTIQYRFLMFQGGRFNRSLVSRLANRFPKSYENRWAWIFPAWYLYFELTSIVEVN
ncbi:MULTISPECIES: class I SAM-dependent methyltransferase [Cyanophyceae]|uniref:Class I SAM-dependent methyltransferase n=1 Tax=Leptolyngbya subtilissima DQ-A4 TaxID=2933933 RepID=A0ABV0K5Q2_9CYAN|nr:class I SAM-dependent methyltransferase [Nodosilinea sp. FACHB-141]MBD2114432.1 class I SAM-dependent methyltransferase [Nodosilinea sp. FACHB-141]